MEITSRTLRPIPDDNKLRPIIVNDVKPKSMPQLEFDIWMMEIEDYNRSIVVEIYKPCEYCGHRQSGEGQLGYHSFKDYEWNPQWGCACGCSCPDTARNGVWDFVEGGFDRLQETREQRARWKEMRERLAAVPDKPSKAKHPITHYSIVEGKIVEHRAKQ